MKRFLIEITILFCFLVLSCSFDPPVNSGSYDNYDSYILSYDGYNSTISNIDKLNTDTGISIKLNGGESSFESVIFKFEEQKNIKSINLKFDDSLSQPDTNCRFVILYDHSNKLFEYNYSEIKTFKELKNLEINKKCSNIRLFFFSNKSDKQTRVITIYTIDFIE